jgi:sugar/nucleoside kinase (ribokinase family)
VKEDIEIKQQKIVHLNDIIVANEKDLVDYRNQLEDKKRKIQELHFDLEELSLKNG